MVEIKKKDIIALYRKLVDPLGYVITTKAGIKTKPWEPEDKAKYDAMDALGLSKEIAELKIQLENLNKIMIEVKKKAINYMNSRQPNSLTETLYTGQYAKNAVETGKVKVTSKTQEGVNRLLNYLEEFKLKKLNEEMMDGFKKEEAGLISMGIEQGIGNPQALNVVIK